MFNGGGGDDAVTFFSNYSTADKIDGGAGTDQVNIVFAADTTLNFGQAQFKNIESLNLGGAALNITTKDNLVAAGQTLAFSSYYNSASQSVVVNGQAETDGSFAFTGGEGDDQFIGGQQADTFFINRGGDDVMKGGQGNDMFHAGTGFTAADQLSGGSGIDTVVINTDLGGKLILGATTFTTIENLDLFSGRSYSIESNDATVGAGRSLTIDGHFMASNEILKFDGSAETNGSFVMIAGNGADFLTGGAMADTFNGGAGDDTIRGNAGDDVLEGGLGKDQLFGGIDNDTFMFNSAAEIGTGASSDVIRDWNDGDIIDLSAIDAIPNGVNDAFAFIGNDPFSAAGQLRVVTTATNTYVRGDINGDGTTDFQITLAGTHTLDEFDFVL